MGLRQQSCKRIDPIITTPSGSKTFSMNVSPLAKFAGWITVLSIPPPPRLQEIRSCCCSHDQVSLITLTPCNRGKTSSDMCRAQSGRRTTTTDSGRESIFMIQSDCVLFQRVNSWATSKPRLWINFDNWLSKEPLIYLNTKWDNVYIRMLWL